MAEKNREAEIITKRETIQLEREQIREKIRELIEAEYARLEEEAEKIAPGFDYEAEGEKLKAEEAEELAKVEFEWADKSTEAKQEPEESKAAADEPAERKAVEYGPLPKAVVSPSKYPKPKYAPKNAVAAALFGDKHRRTLTAAVILLLLFAAYQAWDYLVPKTVNIEYVTYEGTQQIEYATTARTAAEVKDRLTEDGQELSVGENDLLDTDPETPVTNGMTIGIRQATETPARIAGKKQMLWLVPGTVQENLDLNGIAYDDDDEIRPPLEKTVKRNTRITVNEVHFAVEEKTETVEAVDRVILDPSLTSGVQEVSEGNDGEGIFTYTTKFVNGEDMGTEREVKEWITEPHDNILRLGTSATGTSGEYIVVRSFTANTTAYTARPGAHGAIGQVVHVGTCAVDPGFVSLRSELWIEGYGYAFANDTGGAVKGNVVDLFMSSRGQCISWGRRNKQAYVIVPAE